jgi:hypothetical protein
MHRVLIWCCLVMFLLSGCGGSSSSMNPQSPSGATADAKGASSSAPAADMDVMPPAPPAASPPTETSSSGGSDSIARAEPTTQPTERPGLGTQWGESRTSQIEDVSFDRADDDHPFAIAALHYNDLTGVAQLAAFHDAKSHSFREIPTGNGAISVSIVGENGETLEAVHMGDRTYVIGRAGERYSIQLTNHTRHRFESVATVDGLDVMNGRSGNLSNRGYILMPHATLTIDGFRQSRDNVAAFRFSKVSDSYAAQTGTARNVGVIGVAFFTEKGDSINSGDAQDLQLRDTASPFPSDPRFAQPPRN